MWPRSHSTQSRRACRRVGEVPSRAAAAELVQTAVAFVPRLSMRWYGAALGACRASQCCLGTPLPSWSNSRAAPPCSPLPALAHPLSTPCRCRHAGLPRRRHAPGVPLLHVHRAAHHGHGGRGHIPGGAGPPYLPHRLRRCGAVAQGAGSRGGGGSMRLGGRAEVGSLLGLAVLKIVVALGRVLKRLRPSPL